MIKKILRSAFIFIAGLPLLASAHVKWFVESQEVIEKYHGQTSFYTWTSKETLIWGAIVLCAVLAFSIIDHLIGEPKKILSFAYDHENTINRIAQIILGLFLVTVSFIWKIVIVPEVDISSLLLMGLAGLQVVFGLMFILNWKPRIAAAGVVLLTLAIAFNQGILMLLENMLLVGLGIYFYIINSPKDSWVSTKLYKHAVEIVRIATGISLIVLAFTEKILYPELSLQFLEVHQWNFMVDMFPWFTNELFVLSTGFAEMIFGILFIMGYLTRTTTILIALFFAVSVTTMLVQFGAWEVEDLVVYSAAILFLFFGHGRTKFFHFAWPQKFEFLGKSFTK